MASCVHFLCTFIEALESGQRGQDHLPEPVLEWRFQNSNGYLPVLPRPPLHRRGPCEEAFLNLHEPLVPSAVQVRAHPCEYS